MEGLLPALLGALQLSAKLILIIVPLVTLFEVMRYLPVFRRAGNVVEPMMRGVGLTRDAAVPLFTGIFLGIAYGAGIIIRVAQQKGLPARELFLMGLFLATCHSVIEDILIFIIIHFGIITKHILELLSVFPDIGKVKECIMLHSDIYKSSFNSR